MYPITVLTAVDRASVPSRSQDSPASSASQGAASCKSAAWAKPRYPSLAAYGTVLPRLRIYKFLYDALPRRPRASYHLADHYFLLGVGAFGSAAKQWLMDHPRSCPPLSPATLGDVLKTVLTLAFGPPPAGDDLYFRRRHVRDSVGNQLYALFGNLSPYHCVPDRADVDLMIRDIALGWPAPMPVWDRKGIVLVSKDLVSLDRRSGRLAARLAVSRSSDRGLFHYFDNESEFDEWLHSLGRFLVFEDRPRTRLVSSHDSQESAVRMAREAAGVAPVPDAEVTAG